MNVRSWEGHFRNKETEVYQNPEAPTGTNTEDEPRQTTEYMHGGRIVWSF